MTAYGLYVALLDFISFPGLLQLLGKGWLICLLGLYVFSDLELNAAAARNRVVVGAMVCLAALPVISWVAPVWQLPWLPRERGPAEKGVYTWAGIMVWLYVVVAIGMACRLIVQLMRVAAISMRSQCAPTTWLESLNALPHTGEVNLRVSAEITGAVTWGALRPTVLIPTDSGHWSRSERTLILRHELAHIERGDWITVLLARWVCILYWPLPGLRSLFQRLSLSAEQACDDRVLASGGDATDYANVLVKHVRCERLQATLALAQPSELATRVRYLIAEIVDRSTLDPQRRWVYPLCVLLAYPLAPLTFVVEPGVLHIVPLTRAIAQAAPTPTPATVAVATTAIRRPEPPGTVLPPPPKLNLNEKFQWQGDKPSIPPP